MTLTAGKPKGQDPYTMSQTQGHLVIALLGAIVIVLGANLFISVMGTEITQGEYQIVAV